MPIVPFFFSTIAWSTICWQCITMLAFARTTIPSGAGCGCIQVMNNIWELESRPNRGKIDGDTIFTACSQRNFHGMRKRPLLRARKCLSNRKTAKRWIFQHTTSRRHHKEIRRGFHENSSRFNLQFFLCTILFFNFLCSSWLNYSCEAFLEIFLFSK